MFRDEILLAARLCQPIEVLGTDRSIFNALKRHGVGRIYEIYLLEEGGGIVETVRGIGHKGYITLSIDLQRCGCPSLLSLKQEVE